MVSFNLAEGNPGALSFMMEAYFHHDPLMVEHCFQRMADNRISGAKLYMLWNDCCGRDTAFALSIMGRCDIDEIVDHINYERGRGIPFPKPEQEEA